MKKSSLPKDNGLSGVPPESPNGLSGVPPTPSKDSNVLFIVIIIIILLIGLGAVIYFYGASIFGTSESQVTKAPSSITQAPPTPTPTPTHLKSGKDTYNISQAPGVPGPKISSLTLDPLDPKVGDKQTLVAHITYSQPIDSVSINYISDKTKRTLTLTLTGGTATNGDWTTIWTVDDTVLYIYEITISAISNGVKNSVEVAPR